MARWKNRLLRARLVAAAPDALRFRIHLAMQCCHTAQGELRRRGGMEEEEHDSYDEEDTGSSLFSFPVPTPLSPVECAMILDRIERFGRAVDFALRATLALPSALRRPGQLVTQLHAVLLGGLPLAATAGAAIGVVVWMHLRDALRGVGGPGAVQYLPQALSLAVVLEFAPMTAGLLTAGRSGASLGAELGSMKLTEQVEALEVLGLSPLRELVAPRLLACMLALPILTLFITYLALAAGYLAEALGGSMTYQQYVNECLRVLRLGDVLPAMLKTIVFGYLIGLVGCWKGMNAHGGTEGVGHAATGGVVVSIFLVLVANVLLVKLIQVLV
jgi:phospholipid/cholesterol/gamma-HCH transport system permease protein